MSDLAASVQISPSGRIAWLRPKYLLFVVIGLMYAYVLVHNESFLVNNADPEWSHIATFKWFLLPHGLAAGCALLLDLSSFPSVSAAASRSFIASWAASTSVASYSALPWASIFKTSRVCTCIPAIPSNSLS